MVNESEYILVETVQTFRMRYVVKVPIGKHDHALDTVTCNMAKEFSQKYLDETIVSHRPITKEDALVLCDIDNDYLKSWDDETKIRNFFTEIDYD